MKRPKSRKAIVLSLLALPLGGLAAVAVACNSNSAPAQPAAKTAPAQSNVVEGDVGYYVKGLNLPGTDPGDVGEGYLPWVGPLYQTFADGAAMTKPEIQDLDYGSRFNVVYRADVAEGYEGTSYTHTKTFVVVSAVNRRFGAADVTYGQELTPPVLNNYGVPTIVKTDYAAGETLPGQDVSVTWQFGPEAGGNTAVTYFDQSLSVRRAQFPQNPFSDEFAQVVTYHAVFKKVAPKTVPDQLSAPKGYVWTGERRFYAIPRSLDENSPLTVKKGSTTLPTPDGLPIEKSPAGYGPFGATGSVVTSVPANKTDAEKALVGKPVTGGESGTLAKLTEGTTFVIYYTAEATSRKGTNLIVAFKYTVTNNATQNDPGEPVAVTEITEQNVKNGNSGNAFIVVQSALPDSRRYVTNDTIPFTHVAYYTVAS